MAFQRERELYAPVRAFFEGLGYQVRSEVGDADLLAVKEEHLVAVELKLSLNLKLLVQTTQRQKTADLVYAAIPHPGKALVRKEFRNKVHLLRRLGVGLLLVDRLGTVAVSQEPVEMDLQALVQRNRRKRQSLVKEFHGRSLELNQGGANREKLMTAYKEESLRIAYQLEKAGPKAPRELKGYPGVENPQKILYRNVYGWYIHEERGLYGIGPQGKAALSEYESLVEIFAREDE
ncbi:DUF2161 family putative PD-(D/E)XK-type phosphodiesterase [Anaerotalea alkaliphila]|uniref:Endonuclease n=1 Tax=Anaerotalea alkaliphila TaxID=2662126 RepID=A0A7X5HWZ3_9FIRM|nr:DUF2161 family putative PD-(D/E)XK-type phosphodiesterase [Anaerotalea alkaliphila]NDL68172.1 hypothetical protein [Anaerotalea alkaliphila]